MSEPVSTVASQAATGVESIGAAATAVRQNLPIGERLAFVKCRGHCTGAVVSRDVLAVSSSEGSTAEYPASAVVRNSSAAMASQHKFQVMENVHSDGESQSLAGNTSHITRHNLPYLAKASAEMPVEADLTIRPQRHTPCKFLCGGRAVLPDHELAVRWHCQFCAMAWCDSVPSAVDYAHVPAINDLAWYSHISMRYMAMQDLMSYSHLSAAAIRSVAQAGGPAASECVAICFGDTPVLVLSCRTALRYRYLLRERGGVRSETAVAVATLRLCAQHDERARRDGVLWGSSVLHRSALPRVCWSSFPCAGRVSERSSLFPGVNAAMGSDLAGVHRVAACPPPGTKMFGYS